MLWWSVKRGPRRLLHPLCLMDAQATSKMVVGGTSADEDAARCRQLQIEDAQDRDEAEEQEQRGRRRWPSPPPSLPPPEPSASPPVCTITEIVVQTTVGFAERGAGGGRLRASLVSPPPAHEAAEGVRFCSHSATSPSPSLMPLVPRVTCFQLPPPPSSSSPPLALPSCSPELVVVGRGSPSGALAQRPPLPPPHRQRGPPPSRVQQHENDAVDLNDDEAAKLAAAAAASARFVQSTGISLPAPPAPLLLRCSEAVERERQERSAAQRRRAAASESLLRARMTAYAGAAGTLLADIVGPVVVVEKRGGGGGGGGGTSGDGYNNNNDDDDNAARQERALQARASPALLGANALAFVCTLLICGLAGLLGAVGPRPPLDLTTVAVVLPSFGSTSAANTTTQAVATAGVWALLVLRVVWTGLAAQAFASASAALLEAACSACEAGLLIVAAVALLVPRPSWSLSAAALILLLCEMILLTAAEVVRSAIVVLAAGGLECFFWRGRAAQRRATARVAPAPLQRGGA